jgi:hypothetical protein
MNANIAAQFNKRKTNSNPRRDPNYWAERRRWWAHHKIGAGTDWVGVAKTILDVDRYLNGNDAACRQADAERRNPRPLARRDSLPTSTAETIDWLLKYCDEQRLQKFIEGRPATEIAIIHDYIRIKLNGSHS